MGELVDVITGTEKDQYESAEISTNNRGKHQISVECQSLVNFRETQHSRYTLREKAAQDMKKQLELLNGRHYEAHWDKKEPDFMRISVHGFVQLRAKVKTAK